MGPDPEVAAVRLAVRRALATVADPVLVACSGGADSLALLAGAVFETRRDRRPVVGVTVDHGLQQGSTAHADQVAAQMADLGADETMSIRVRVDAPGIGPEAAAREARYAALSQAAAHVGAGVVLLGHTRDDQAETVLLGLARGSGGRSLCGMRRGFREDGVWFLRPLLDLTRPHTEAACASQGIAFWRDPHNEDPRFTRARVRHRVLPMLEDELGAGVAAALARTADALREDMDALDDLAKRELDRLSSPLGLATGELGLLEAAVAHRVLRRAALQAGATASELFRSHVLAMRELVRDVDDVRRVQLPGRVTAYRASGYLRFGPTPVRG